MKGGSSKDFSLSAFFCEQANRATSKDFFTYLGFRKEKEEKWIDNKASC